MVRPRKKTAPPALGEAGGATSSATGAFHYQDHTTEPPSTQLCTPAIAELAGRDLRRALADLDAGNLIAAWHHAVWAALRLDAATEAAP